jgi:hypothetical protein
MRRHHNRGRDATEPTLRDETHADDFGPSVSPTLSRGDHRDTAVPLEARLLRDAQGKVIFIGDCAPISFLQTVRHLIATGAEALPLQASRDSFVEAVQPEPANDPNRELPVVHIMSPPVDLSISLSESTCQTLLKNLPLLLLSGARMTACRLCIILYARLVYKKATKPRRKRGSLTPKIC